MQNIIIPTTTPNIDKAYGFNLQDMVMDILYSQDLLFFTLDIMPIKKRYGQVCNIILWVKIYSMIWMQNSVAPKAFCYEDSQSLYFFIYQRIDFRMFIRKGLAFLSNF